MNAAQHIWICMSVHESYGLTLWYFNVFSVMFWSLPASTHTHFLILGQILLSSLHRCFHSISVCVFCAFASVSWPGQSGFPACDSSVPWQEVFFFLNRICIQFRAKLKTLRRQTNIYFFPSIRLCMHAGNKLLNNENSELSVWRTAASLGNRKRSLFQAKESKREWGKSPG